MRTFINKMFGQTITTYNEWIFWPTFPLVGIPWTQQGWKNNYTLSLLLTYT